LLERGGTPGATPEAGVSGVTIAGRPVALYIGCNPADGGSSTEQVLEEARRLVEQVGVDVLVAPTATLDELALQEYARMHPHTTFVDGAGAAPDPNPAPNFFSFDPNGAQWMAGLGSYAYHRLGWRRAVEIAFAPDAFSWEQVAAFTAEFCSLGGTIAKRIFYPLYTSDWSAVVSRVPRRGIDGIVFDNPNLLVALAKSDPALNGSLARKVIATSIGLLPTIDQLGRRAEGIVTAGPSLQLPNADARPGLAPSALYRREFRRWFPGVPTLEIGFFDVPYYVGMAATLDALAAVHGDLSHGERRFMSALAHLRLDAPNGSITLDSRHRAIGPNYLWRLEGPKLQPVVIRTIPRVDQSFGGYFKATDPPPSATTPACVKRAPPGRVRRGGSR
jgi:branched-chain amino acid transport system substrate-binding protein